MVDEIVRNGDDIRISYFPGKFSYVANAFKVSRTTVINLEQPLHTEHTIDSCRDIGGNNSDLSQGDLQFIKNCKRARRTSSLMG